MYIILSLPVGAWLYGLVFGALRRTEPPTTAAQCTAALEHARIIAAQYGNGSGSRALRCLRAVLRRAGGSGSPPRPWG